MWNFLHFVYIFTTRQENGARWHFEAVTRPPRSFIKFLISAGSHLVFSKGVHRPDFGSKSEICQFQGGERATKTIYQDFDLGLFSSSNFYQRGQPTFHYTIPDSFSCQNENLSRIVWTATVWEWSKYFTHIEHRVGATDHTAPKYGTQPFRYVTLHYWDRRGRALLAPNTINSHISHSNLFMTCVNQQLQ